MITGAVSPNRGLRRADRFRVLVAAAALGVLLASAPSPSAAQGAPPDTRGWLRQRFFDARFSLLMPEGWEVAPTGDPETRVRIAAAGPASPDRPGSASCNVKLGAVEATEGMTQAALEAHVLARPLTEAAARRALGPMARTEIRTSTVGRVGGRPARIVVGAGEEMGPRGRVWVVARQAILLRPGSAIVVTCRATDRTREAAEAAWSAWQPVLAAVIDSLEVED